jgi:hypothetical protein
MYFLIGGGAVFMALAMAILVLACISLSSLRARACEACFAAEAELTEARRKLGNISSELSNEKHLNERMKQVHLLECDECRSQVGEADLARIISECVTDTLTFSDEDAKVLGEG